MKNYELVRCALTLYYYFFIGFWDSCRQLTLVCAHMVFHYVNAHNKES